MKNAIFDIEFPSLSWAQHLASRWYTGSKRIEDCVEDIYGPDLEGTLITSNDMH